MEYLKQFTEDGPHLRIDHSRQSLEVFFVPVQPGQVVEIDVPSGIPFQVSGNNDDGFVVTLWRTAG